MDPAVFNSAIHPTKPATTKNIETAEMIAKSALKEVDAQLLFTF